MTKDRPVEPGVYNLAEMAIRFGKSRSWILLRAKEPGFPKPRRLGKTLAWIREDVDRYILELPEAKGSGLDAIAAMEHARRSIACA